MKSSRVRTLFLQRCLTASFAAMLVIIATTATAQFGDASGDAKSEVDSPDAGREAEEKKPPGQPAFGEPAGARRLSPRYPVWIDPNKKAVIVDGQVSLTKGMLEMFACTRNTKEHESVVSADTQAYLVHTGLLRLGAQPGHPAQFQPTYRPPSGTEIDITVEWKDASGKMQKARAQDWVKDRHTGKAMTYPFVFGGSSFWKDPDTGNNHYQAEGGDFVCVSNFGTAMLDIPVKSSQSNEELEFEAFTERIPPLGAPVRLFFKPKLEKQ